MSKILCDWTTYKGSHCKKIINYEYNDNNNDKKNHKHSSRFCDLHRDLITRYTKISKEELGDEELCAIFKEIKVTPRSYKHLKTVMSNIGNEDNRVQIYLAGGYIEDADISNVDFIVLDSDNSRFYYTPQKGQNKAKDLKVILREYCQQPCLVNFNGLKYCEECYKNKIKDAPRISCLD